MTRPSAKTAALYVGRAIVSGALGWVALMVAFEGAWWAECYLAKRRRGP